MKSTSTSEKLFENVKYRDFLYSQPEFFNYHSFESMNFWKKSPEFTGGENYFNPYPTESKQTIVNKCHLFCLVANSRMHLKFKIFLKLHVFYKNNSSSLYYKNLLNPRNWFFGCWYSRFWSAQVTCRYSSYSCTIFRLNQFGSLILLQIILILVQPTLILRSHKNHWNCFLLKFSSAIVDGVI